MSGKSRHGRAKQLSQSKKRKKTGDSAAIVRRQTVAQIDKPILESRVSASPVITQTPEVAQTAARYHTVPAEMRRIGILAGIVLVILVVLALVLS